MAILILVLRCQRGGRSQQMNLMTVMMNAKGAGWRCLIQVAVVEEEVEEEDEDVDGELVLIEIIDMTSNLIPV
nr:hypothetical protein Iba_chr04bCG11850 [Ipomoea batatas]